MIKNFRDLEIWQKGMEIVEDVYKLTEKYPSKEQFGLKIQTQNSAVSIPSNIAEGFNRFYIKEYKRFLFISLGSCGELETQLEIAARLKYIAEFEKEIIINKVVIESKMLNSLINKLK